MQHLISCTCGEVLVKSMDAETKVRAKVVVFRDGQSFAVCKGCNAEVKIPLQLDTSMLKSMTAATPERVRLYIRAKTS